MKRLALLLLAGLPLLLGALWLGPRLVDWEPWRAQLAEIATSRLGRPVTLDGPVELVLLPQPMLRAAGVSVGGREDGFAASARLLRLQLDLFALLLGRIEPREVALVGAELTLPWPPGPLLAVRPPPWITEFDAQVEDSRVRIGGTLLEGVTARLSSGGAAQVLEIAGGFAWSGRAARFAATLGRPGWDGIATFDLSITLPEVNGRARGVLVPEGGFEGTLEAAGPDLSAILPSPAVPFRAAGRLNATAELVAADELSIDLGGAPARGAVAFRLLPLPRLDVALLASRLDLDGWVAALRQGGPRAWPVSLDLSAEAASLGGVALRRLRGAAFLEEGRLTLSDVAVLLPGETELELAGATAGARLELGARFAGADLRSSLLALGLPVEGLDPTLFRRGEGRLRLVLEEAQATVPDFAATLEGFRVSGAGVLRHGARPALGLGLSVDRLDLARWLPEGMDAAQALRGIGGAVDLNLRLAADRAVWGAAALDGAAVDLALEGGRLTLRRLAGRLAEADIAASGTLALAPALRWHELSVEANGPSARGLAALLPGTWPDGAALVGRPVSLRVGGSGPPEALALRGTLDLGEARLEANGTLDLPGQRGGASLTLRHPFAPRLIAEAFGTEVGAWLGEGSLSLVATVAAGPQGVSAESFELVAAALRMGGALQLAAGPRPRLTGRIQAERLPLPLPALRSAEPLPLDALPGLDAELSIAAARVEAGPVVAEAASAQARLENGVLTLDRLRARVVGGTLEGGGTLTVAAGAPARIAAEMRLAGATLAAPLLGLPFDIAAGRGDVTLRVAAEGHAPAAMLGTLSGSWTAALRDGVVTGFDLSAAATGTGMPEAEAEPNVRRALTAGATAFERMDLEGALDAGRLRIAAGRLAAEGGVAAQIEGEADLARGTIDLRLSARLASPEAPEIGLRVTGPAEAPRVLPETAAWTRWRAERG